MCKKILTTICIIFLLLFSGGLFVHASTTYGFETNDLSQEEKNKIWQNININVLTDDISLDNIKLPIVSFDVSKSMILLGFEGNKVVVVNEKGKVINYLEFCSDGSFYVQWRDNNILLLLVRGSIIVEVSPNGQLINMVKADDSSIQNNSLWNEIAKKNHISIDESSYYIRNQMGILNFFSPSYSQLVYTDSNGNETIIYDINTAQTAKTVTILIAAFLFVSLAVYVIIRQVLKTKEQKISNLK